MTEPFTLRELRNLEAKAAGALLLECPYQDDIVAALRELIVIKEAREKWLKKPKKKPRPWRRQTR